jgi:hypothetical protein
VRPVKLPREDDVLAALRRSVVESHYGYAPGRASLHHVCAALSVAGFPRGEKTRLAAETLLARLVEAGRLRRVEVVEPSGEPSHDWFEVAITA